MCHVLPLTILLSLTFPFYSIEELPVSFDPNDTEKADMRIVQAAAQEVIILLNSLVYNFLSLSLSLAYRFSLVIVIY